MIWGSRLHVGPDSGGRCQVTSWAVCWLEMLQDDNIVST